MLAYYLLIIQNSERVPRLCAQLLPRIRAWAKKRPSFPVVSWEEFVREVKEVNKTADEEGVRNVAFYLNESAEVRTCKCHLPHRIPKSNSTSGICLERLA